MKKIFIIILIVAGTAALSFLAFGYFFLTDDPNYSTSVLPAKIQSKILNEERNLIIHLPDDYDKTKKYPVMYILDGSSEDVHISASLNTLNRAGYMPQMIPVGIPNTSGEGRQIDYTPPHMISDIDIKDSPKGRGDKFIDFLEQELIPYMEKNYSVSDYRLFSGYSRGGLLVMYSLQYKPGLFKARFCYSPALWREDDRIVKETAAYLTRQDSMDTFLYLSLGTAENDKMKAGYTKMLQVLKNDAPKGLVWHSAWNKGADHQNNSKRSAPLALRKWSEFYQSH